MTSDPNTGRVVPLAPPTHDEAQRLLPWLLTGRLAEDERAMVQAHLATCPRCQGELEWERKLQARYAELAGEADAERGLAALRGQLMRPADQQPLLARAAHGWRRAWAAWQGLGVGLRGVLVAQGAAVLALAVVLLSVLPARDGAYKALGSATSATPANAVVRFRPEAQDLAIRQALQGSGARLVDGPTVSGAYLVHLPAVERDSALRRLRTDPAGLLAESLE